MRVTKQQAAQLEVSGGDAQVCALVVVQACIVKTKVRDAVDVLRHGEHFEGFARAGIGELLGEQHAFFGVVQGL